VVFQLRFPTKSFLFTRSLPLGSRVLAASLLFAPEPRDLRVLRLWFRAAPRPSFSGPPHWRDLE